MRHVLADMLLMGTAQQSHATVRKVPLAYATIPSAISAAVDGDTILVGPGVYPAWFNINKSLAVIAEFGPRYTILELEVVATGILFYGDFSGHPGPRVLRGFHIAGSGTTRPVQINTNLSADYRIERCIFDRLKSDQTIVIYGNNAQIRVAHNTFYGGNPLVSGFGPGCAATQAPSPALTQVRGNLLVKSARALWAYTSAQLSSDYNCLYGNLVDYAGTASPGDSDLLADPLIDTLSLGLLPGSPCIDAGDPNPAFNDPDGTRSDIGALPFDSIAWPVARLLAFGPYGVGHLVIDSVLEIRWSYVDTASSVQSHYEVEVSSDFTWSDPPLWSTGPAAGSDYFVTYAGPMPQELTTYGVRIRVAANGDWGTWKYSFFTLHRPVQLVVPTTYATIQAAMDAAFVGDTVLVKPGLYREHLNFKGKNIAVIAEAGRDSTFIEAVLVQTPLVTITNGEDTGAVFDGFTLRNSQDLDGIVLRNSSPTIRNCDIHHLVELGRGGHAIIGHDSSPRIVGNRLHHNACQGPGAGVRIFSSRFGRPTVIAYNDIFNNWGGAVAVQSVGNLVVHHNLVRGNFGQGLVSVDLHSFGFAFRHKVYANTVLDGFHGLRMSDLVGDSAFNNILAGMAGAGMLGTPVQAYFDYNDVWDNDSGGVAGPNGISADPLFNDAGLGDFSLASGSPCIDAGLPDTAYNDPDLTRSDMGAGSMAGPPHSPYWACPIANLRLGDQNQNGTVTSSDIIKLVNYCFKSGAPPLPCEAMGDIDCSGTVTAGDIIGLVGYVFLPPAAEAGADPMKGGGDPPCNVCRLIWDGTWSCP